VAAIRYVLMAVIAAIASGSFAHADFRTGEAAYKAGNYGDAYLQLLGPGHGGNAQAQFLLGQMSDSGLGPVALDPREAVRWYRLAAARKHAEAQYALARAYALGRGVKQDKDQAVKWLTAAAELNFEPALLDLAQLYDDGRGVTKDEARATKLMERAATLGHPDAQYAFAERLASGTGTARDQKRAWQWFKRAADAGQPAALYRMGQVIFKAERSIEDNIAAYAWLTLAERRGTGGVKRDAAQDKALLAKDMTPGDIAAAMQRVRAWKAPERPAKQAQGG
jgi:TPR repeat protein